MKQYTKCFWSTISVAMLKNVLTKHICSNFFENGTAKVKLFTKSTDTYIQYNT